MGIGIIFGQDTFSILWFYGYMCIICMEFLRRYDKVCQNIFLRYNYWRKIDANVKRTTIMMASNPSLMDLNAISADGC